MGAKTGNFSTILGKIPASNKRPFGFFFKSDLTFCRMFPNLLLNRHMNNFFLSFIVQITLMEIKIFSQCTAANKQQWCGLVAAASCSIVAACELFICKLVLLLLVAATLRLLVAATLQLLVAATLQLPVAATLQLLVAATLRLLVASTLQLFVCRECVGLVVDCF